MLATFVLAVSMGVQIAAALVALRLSRSTGWQFAWLLIATAVTLMAVRRGVTLSHAGSAPGAQPPDLHAELVALLISLLMLVGLYRIGPLFHTISRARDQAQASQVQCQLMFEQASDAIALLGLATGGVFRANERLAHLAGRPVTELVSGKAGDLFVAGDMPAYLPGCRPLLQGGEGVVSQCLRLGVAGGGAVPVEVNTAVVSFSSGQVLQSIIRGIGARERADRLVQRFGRVLDNSFDEIDVFAAETLRFQHANQGASGNPGYPVADLLDLTALDVVAESHRRRMQELLSVLRTSQSTLQQSETAYQRKDGSVYPVEVRLPCLAAENPPVFVAIVLDITERQRARQVVENTEAPMRHLLTASPVVIYSMHAGADFAPTYLSDNVAALTGFTPDELTRDPTRRSGDGVCCSFACAKLASGRCRWTSRTAGRALRSTPLSSCSRLSKPENPKGWGWGCQSAGPSSRRTAAGCGLITTTNWAGPALRCACP